MMFRTPFSVYAPISRTDELFNIFESSNRKIDTRNMGVLARGFCRLNAVFKVFFVDPCAHHRSVLQRHVMKLVILKRIHREQSKHRYKVNENIGAPSSVLAFVEMWVYTRILYRKSSFYNCGLLRKVNMPSLKCVENCALTGAYV